MSTQLTAEQADLIATARADIRAWRDRRRAELLAERAFLTSVQGTFGAQSATAEARARDTAAVVDRISSVVSLV